MKWLNPFAHRCKVAQSHPLTYYAQCQIVAPTLFGQRNLLGWRFWGLFREAIG
jgi:hypothetical protein